jgi:hypothetical protein
VAGGYCAWRVPVLHSARVYDGRAPNLSFAIS